MKSLFLALAAILATTAAAGAAPAPLALTHSDLVEIVQRADGDPRTTRGFVGAHLVLDLRPGTKHPYFVASQNVHGLAFICQPGFDNFAGGPITATVILYEPGQDGRDHVTLDGCTGLER